MTLWQRNGRGEILLTKDSFIIGILLFIRAEKYVYVESGVKEFEVSAGLKLVIGGHIYDFNRFRRTHNRSCVRF